MRRGILAAVAAALPLLGAVEARAAVSSVEVRAQAAAAHAVSRTVTHRGVRPFAALDQVAALGQFWTSNSLYALGGANGERRWVIRRSFGQMSGDKGLVWADSRACPAVKSVLEAMEALPAVRLHAPGVGPQSQRAPLMDGIAHRFWNQGARTGAADASVAVEIDGNADSPVAEWWSDAIGRLEGCWTEQEPAA